VILCTDTYFHSKALLEERQESLFDTVKKEMKHAQVNTLEKVFFPVVALGNSYLLCIKFMKGSLELIDNRLLDNKISFVHKYKNHPRTLMKWRSNDYYDDCGIYLLKHMETYHREKDIECENGLQLNSVDQMEKLRVEYCGKIILHKKTRSKSRQENGQKNTQIDDKLNFS
ncbi:putative indole-3-pyruvate monooxygenase YUCCA3, partial [Bienertia sinuspersici]